MIERLYPLLLLAFALAWSGSSFSILGQLAKGWITFTAKDGALRASLSKLRGLAGGMLSFFRRLVRGFMVMGAAALGVAYLLIRSLQSQQEAEKKLEAVLRSTGHAAGWTKDQLIKMAGALQKVTTWGDEAIITLQAILATFTQIKGPIFKAAVEIVADMATVLGTDLKAGAIQVGKALNDPIKGVTALSKVGVSFTQKQRDMIRVLVESGKVMEAQKVILAELAVEFGGAASLQADTLGGKLKQLKNRVGDLVQMFAAKMEPALSGAIDDITSLVEILGESPESIVDFTDAISDLIWKVVSLADWFGKLRKAWLQLRADLAKRTIERTGISIGEARAAMKAAKSDMDRLKAQQLIVRAMKAQAAAAGRVAEIEKDKAKTEAASAWARKLGRGDVLRIGVMDWTEAAKADRDRVQAARESARMTATTAKAAARGLAEEKRVLAEMEGKRQTKIDEKRVQAEQAGKLRAAEKAAKDIAAIMEKYATDAPLKKRIADVQEAVQKIVELEKKAGKEIVDEQKFQAEQMKKIREDALGDTLKKAKSLRKQAIDIGKELTQLRKDPAPRWMQLQQMFKSLTGRPADADAKRMRELSAKRTKLIQDIVDLDKKRNEDLATMAKAMKDGTGIAIAARP